MDGVVEAIDEHPFVGPLDGGQGPGQPPGRVGQNRAVGGVGVAAHCVRLQLHVEQALHAESDLGDALPGDAAALPDAGVGSEEAAVLFHELLHVRAADLLVALDAELDGAGQPAPHLLPGPQGGQAGGDVALVVGNASPVQLAVALRGLEGRRRP